MTIDEDAKIYGRKAAMLKYISETDLDIPIEPFVLIPRGEDWKKYEKDINALGHSLVRSSSPIEDNGRVSFAGLFQTAHFLGQESIDRVINSKNHGWTEKYAKAHGINPENIDIHYFFQKKSRSRYNYGMLRHPHKNNLIFIGGRFSNRIFDPWWSDNLVYDENKNAFYDVHRYFYRFGKKPVEENSVNDGLISAIAIFKDIERMPEIDKKYSYHMEFGTSPLSIYQFRPFKPKEKSAWKINKKDFDNFGNFKISFGITPPEGIELKVFNIINFSDMCTGDINNILASSLSKEQIRKQLIEYRSVLGKDKTFLNMLLEDKYLSSDITLEAIRRTASKADKNTIIFHDGMHDYRGEPIDILLPEPKVFAGKDGLEFISHDWFRIAQHYDITLFGGTMYEKTGKKKRVYSDGVESVIV